MSDIRGSSRSAIADRTTGVIRTPRGSNPVDDAWRGPAGGCGWCCHITTVATNVCKCRVIQTLSFANIQCCLTIIMTYRRKKPTPSAKSCRSGGLCIRAFRYSDMSSSNPRTMAKRRWGRNTHLSACGQLEWRLNLDCIRDQVTRRQHRRARSPSSVRPTVGPRANPKKNKNRICTSDSTMPPTWAW